MKVNFDEQGNIERIHPDPREGCNLDDAKDVREMTLADVLAAAYIAVASKRLTAEGRIRALVCGHCGG